MGSVTMKIGLLFLVAWMVPYHVTSSTLPINSGSKFCTKREKLLTCTFSDTNQPVEMKEVQSDIQHVRVVSANTFFGHSTCRANLEVSTSSNVTLVGANADIVPNKEMSPKTTNAEGRHLASNMETVNQDIPILFPQNEEIPILFPQNNGNRTYLLTKILKQLGKSLNSSSRDAKISGGECGGKVSVHQSDISVIQGDFDVMSIRSSKVRKINGTFRDFIKLKDSQILEFAAAGVNVTIEETRIQHIYELDVIHNLQFNQVIIENVDELGVMLGQPAGNLLKDAAVHQMNNVEIGSLKTGKLVVSGTHLIMKDVIINETSAGVIVVESGGKLTLNNVHIRRGPDVCLILKGQASVDLTNVMIGKKKINQLDMAIDNNDWPVYPLRSQSLPVTTLVRIRPVGNENSGEESDETSLDFIGMDWYWLPVMAAVGMVSGMVIGVAMNCNNKQNKNTNLLSSSLTFSDLIAREKCEEENCNNQACVFPHRPELVRQDSGLTTSSFASYTAGPGDRQFPSARRTEDFENGLIDTADPNMFIHVPSSMCTRQDIIYEEVEALPPARIENNYVDMV